VPPVATETVLLHTADGLAIDAEVSVPPAPWAAAVVAHPHPLYGGDMHNHVVTALYRSLPAAGIATVRFDFRGVGLSEGEHDHGQGERLDVAAAVDLVAPYASDGPVVLCGYSFGAIVAAQVVHPRLAGWLLVAAPLGEAPALLAAPDHRPKLLLVPEHDQLTSPAEARRLTAGWAATTVEDVPMADHSLLGATAAVAARAVELSRSLA